MVLPGATATDFWEIAETPLEHVPSEMVMKTDEMVDAAIAGFDQGELLTLPPCPIWLTGKHMRQQGKGSYQTCR